MNREGAWTKDRAASLFTMGPRIRNKLIPHLCNIGAGTCRCWALNLEVCN